MTGYIINLVLAVVPVILAITLHEIAHGYAALALGDTTARDARRLSLNPLRHIDRVGTILLPGFLLVTQLLFPPHKIFFMFGWAKPVPVNAMRFRNPRRMMAVVALAGPAANFVLAWLAALVFPMHAYSYTQTMAQQFLIYFMLSNIVLGMFNLLPIPPLDGGRVAVGILPLGMARVWARLERAGILIVLLVVFILPRMIDFDPIGEALDHALPWAFRTLFWLAGRGLGNIDGNFI